VAEKRPGGCLEESVVFDVGGAAAGAEPLGFIFDQKFADDVFT
jgi:hypothetical protein